MAYEYIEDFDSGDYIIDTERGLKLQKSGGGSGFSLFTLSAYGNEYSIHIQKISHNVEKRSWVLDSVSPKLPRLNKHVPLEVYGIALDILVSFKNHAWKDMADEITVTLSDDIKSIDGVIL